MDATDVPPLAEGVAIVQVNVLTGMAEMVTRSIEKDWIADRRRRSAKMLLSADVKVVADRCFVLTGNARTNATQTLVCCGLRHVQLKEASQDSKLFRVDCCYSQAQLREQRDAAVAAEQEAAAHKASQLLRALDAHQKPLLMVDCGPDGAWRVVFANTPAGEQAGGSCAPGVTCDNVFVLIAPQRALNMRCRALHRWCCCWQRIPSLFLLHSAR
jgi:hypothetical protein